MDPNETLRLLLAAAVRWEESDGKDTQAADEMMSATYAIDDWLRWGGAWPKAWHRDLCPVCGKRHHA